MQYTDFNYNKTSHPLNGAGKVSTHIMQGIGMTVIQNYVMCLKNGISFYQEILLSKTLQVFYILISDNGNIHSEIFCNLP